MEDVIIRGNGLIGVNFKFGYLFFWLVYKFSWFFNGECYGNL